MAILWACPDPGPPGAVTKGAALGGRPLHTGLGRLTLGRTPLQPSCPRPRGTGASRAPPCALGPTEDPVPHPAGTQGVTGRAGGGTVTDSPRDRDPGFPPHRATAGGPRIGGGGGGKPQGQPCRTGALTSRGHLLHHPTTAPISQINKVEAAAAGGSQRQGHPTRRGPSARSASLVTLSPHAGPLLPGPDGRLAASVVAAEATGDHGRPQGGLSGRRAHPHPRARLAGRPPQSGVLALGSGL